MKEIALLYWYLLFIYIVGKSVEMWSLIIANEQLLSPPFAVPLIVIVPLAVVDGNVDVPKWLSRLFTYNGVVKILLFVPPPILNFSVVVVNTQSVVVLCLNYVSVLERFEKYIIPPLLFYMVKSPLLALYIRAFALESCIYREFIVPAPVVLFYNDRIDTRLLL